MKSFLNVGGNNKTTPVPKYYSDWRHDLLDIDPQVKPDILCDGRELNKLRPESYDSVYCSHNLEHYYAHDTYKVIKGFFHILKQDGFINIVVPDVFQAIYYALVNNLDINDDVANSPSGGVKVKYFIYGRIFSEDSKYFDLHKTGFTNKSLKKLVTECGFVYPSVLCSGLEIRLYAFKQKPSEELKIMLNLKDDF